MKFPSTLGLAALAFTLFAPLGDASAACSCRCVDGKAQPVCSSSTDIPPLCQSTNCPIAPPPKMPYDVREPPPTMKPGCETKRVYNPETSTYGWEQICN